MQKIIIFLFAILSMANMFCQEIEVHNKFNLDFENIENGLPIGWNISSDSNYKLSIDSLEVNSGKYSLLLESNRESSGFYVIRLELPNNYAGKKITFSGYIKTENVTDGYAGLWMRIDPDIAFDNMSKRGIKASTDWKQYEITLNMNPLKTENIIIGCLLVGKGKIWIDNLCVKIDGNNIENLESIAYKTFPARLDKEFDNSSGIQNIDLSKVKYENLHMLGLIWGFLKYYHPNIAKGDFNWDYELFRVLPKLIEVENVMQRDKLFVEWINSFGEFEEKDSKSKKDNKKIDIKQNPDLGWIKKSKLSKELTNLLLSIEESKRGKEHYYIDAVPGVGNPIFKNEKTYGDIKFPDTGYALLSLYKYWNIIQYYFPYKYLIEEDWKEVLKEFIPKFCNIENELEYNLAVLEIIARIHDTHANILESKYEYKKYCGEKFIPVELEFVENKVIVIDFYNEYYKNEFKVGDVISSINGKSVDVILSEKLKFTPASNYPTQLREIAGTLLRTNDSIIELDIIRDGLSIKKIISTQVYDNSFAMSVFQKNDTCFKLINSDVGYIYMGNIKTKYLSEIWKSIENTKGLIIDLRAYPSDFVVFSLGQYLMPKSTGFVKFSKLNLEKPGEFRLSKMIFPVGVDNPDYYKGKVIILVNEFTQSNAEYTAMAFRVAPDVTVIGSTTAGADGNVSNISLPGGIVTSISGIGIYYPDGRETQRVGIIPDIEVKPTIQGVKEGRDELLEKAIELINNK